MKNERVIYRVANWVIMVSVIAIMILLNYFIRDASWRIDLTETKTDTLTKETIDYIKTVDKDMTIIILKQDTPDDSYIERIAKLYHKVNPKIKVKIVDPDKNPVQIEKYLKKDETLRLGSVVIDDGNRWELINIVSMGGQDSNGNIVMKVESKITNTINKLMVDRDSTIYLLTGHGEKDINGIYDIKEDLNDIMFSVVNLNLLAEGKVPDDAYSLAILGPTKDISDKERDIIKEYLENGGNITMAIDVDTTNSNFKNIKEIITGYNLKLEDNFVCEGKGHCAADEPIALLPRLSYNKYTQNIIRNGLTIYMPLARSIDLIDKENKDVEATPILMTSEKSWAETNYEELPPVKDEKDAKGPLAVGAIAIKKNEDKESKLVLFGNSIFIDNQLLRQYATLGNKEVFTTSIKWFETEEITKIEVKPKLVKAAKYTTNSNKKLMLAAGSLSIPLVLMAAGAFVFIKRRD
ncbi:MAG: GldG family protein [Clostridiales bacterium]|nr:GldG family protein [Clostridiales bacterium]